jgi:EAL domain-containing protein (putative c-di-GMP-specific phosphodiesterase class I)
MISLNSSINLATDARLHPELVERGVMVVDDSSVHRFSADACLRAFGIDHIYEAGDGRAALQLLDKLPTPPAVLLLDLEMPVMDGVEVLQHLASAPMPPAVVLASSSDEVLIGTVATMAEAMGICLLGAFRKPVDASAMLTALCRYSPGDLLSIPAEPETSLELAQLRKALEERRLEVYYQPKIQLDTGKLAGVEALARWREGGDWVSPLQFIALAEEHDLIDQLTLCLFERILEDMNRWWDEGCYIPVAMNLSAKSLADPELANAIIQRVAAQGIPAHFLSFEITESALVVDLPPALATISRLRLKGYGISIDDYGTGFSSMQQLSRFPFSELKIDRYFVDGAPSREHLQSILKSAIDMGQRLGITTVAEGVETLAELQLLKRLGCKQAQGFLLARPMPGDKLLPWMDTSLESIRELCQM